MLKNFQKIIDNRVIKSIFVKQNYVTDRIIRQVDIAPTLAYLGGVRMPRNAEGAILHQLLEQEF